MKPFQRYFLLILYFNLFSFFQCDTEYYDGSQRIIIEGKISHSSASLEKYKVEIYPCSADIKSSDIVALNNDYSIYRTEHPIGIATTDASGTLQMSIPQHESYQDYLIVVKGYNTSKSFGYISPLNIRNYRVNLGTLEMY